MLVREAVAYVSLLQHSRGVTHPTTVTLTLIVGTDYKLRLTYFLSLYIQPFRYSRTKTAVQIAKAIALSGRKYYNSA